MPTGGRLREELGNRGQALLFPRGAKEESYTVCCCISRRLVTTYAPEFSP